ncbi:MAG: hypothetical protein NWT00_03370 [Beijerinckiaceae bacterium]|jgi:tetratricopeptide (TPR) repeat protein|nr:hypothetical protein [Beijerinckiaceae bacterium]
MNLHPAEAKFQQLISRGKPDEAQKSLEEYKAINPADKTGICCMEAWLMRKQGNIDGAIDVLTNAIEAGETEFCRCHMSRVALYLKKGDLHYALADCETILTEEAPHIKASFHNCYRFMKAYILARLKNQKFERELSLIPENYIVWIAGKNWKADDLNKLYMTGSAD